MRKFFTRLFVLLGVGLLIYLSFYTLTPSVHLSKTQPQMVFSTKRAYQHVKKIAQKPHYVGSVNHSKVRNYIVQELQKMGLDVHTQNGFVINPYRVLSDPENIITRLKGSHPQPGSDLLVLAHYDSAPHSSYGASDDGAAIAAILESLRVFLARKTPHKNNIIICFTDAEEIGLLGAQLFAEQYPGIKDIGLVINFEARGTSGPANTIIETNHGNAHLVSLFARAKPAFPMASSLMYEIYKNMPNDTDATVFRVDWDIPSFFFAFIDDPYNYHTASDIPKNLSLHSLADQGAYLDALLPYFGNHNLATTETTKNQVYFNFPLIGVVHYAYSLIYPLLILAWIGFFLLLFFGFKEHQLQLRRIGGGFVAFFLSVLLVLCLGYFGWKLLMQLYPQYGEIQLGFPYNGHTYIVAFVFLSLFILFGIYHFFSRSPQKANLVIAPLLAWLLINTALALAFKGASFFILPVLFTEIALALMLFSPKNHLFIRLFLCIPALFIFPPLILYIPVALGMKLIFAALALLVLIFGLLLPVFEAFPSKNAFAVISLILGLLFLVIAHFHSGFSPARPKPNSLVYLLNRDQQTATWNTYDALPDSWTRPFFKNEQENPLPKTMMGSKYGEGFTYSSPAPLKPIPPADIEIHRDSSGGGFIHYHLKIIPRRSVSRMVLYCPQVRKFHNFKANGVTVPKTVNESSKIRHSKSKRKRLLTFYPVESPVLQLDFDLPSPLPHPRIIFYSAGNNLLDNPHFNIPPRTKAMMPRPFVLNDAIITKRTIALRTKP